MSVNDKSNDENRAKELEDLRYNSAIIQELKRQKEQREEEAKRRSKDSLSPCEDGPMGADAELGDDESF